MGKPQLENSIHKEAEMLVAYLEETSMDKPTEIDWSINVAVLNVISQLLTGDKLPDADIKSVIYKATKHHNIL